MKNLILGLSGMLLVSSSAALARPTLYTPGLKLEVSDLFSPKCIRQLDTKMAEYKQAEGITSCLNSAAASLPTYARIRQFIP